MGNIKAITVGLILNSIGNFAIEVEIELNSGAFGIASAPSAIKCGRRERKTTALIKDQISIHNKQVQRLVGFSGSQKQWDNLLMSHVDSWGTDLTLSLSLAFARAVAKEEHFSLTNYISQISCTKKEQSLFCPLIPIFSGGVHAIEFDGSMQQIMISLQGLPFLEAVCIIREFYFSFYKTISQSHYFQGYSASSGFLTRGLGVEDEFDILSEAIEKSPFSSHISIAIDVAAEHLKKNDGYMFYNKTISAKELESCIQKYVKSYPISYVEDPFDSDDFNNWKSLYMKTRKTVDVFLDDFCATQVRYLDPTVANGVIVKLKQVGTLSDAIELIKKARELNMKICVSHRSIETEDTFMCDLGIAANAEYMKIGGPRSGDRVSKYNRLLRILTLQNE